MSVERQIFRSYDIRGVVGSQLTPEVVESIGRAFGSEILEQGQSNTCVVARDGRVSSPLLVNALIQGLQKSGIDVSNVGMVPTPVLYYAGFELKTSGSVMVTGSHNPGNYNGLKFSLNELPFAGSKITDLYQRVVQQEFKSGNGGYTDHYVLGQYVKSCSSQFDIDSNLHVVVDCGNGVSGVLCRKLFEAIGCLFTMMYEEVDGTFPNHHPDPCVTANLKDLKREVLAQGADLGIAFDGDGDRLGVVTEVGEVVPADQLLALFATDILKANTGRAVVFDVKCGYCVQDAIKDSNGVGVLSPTGHTHIKTKLREHDAVLGGELSGHLCFPDRWYPVDDAAYVALRFLELMTKASQQASALVSDYQQAVSTEELFIDVDEDRKFDIVASLQDEKHFDGANKVLLDGVRVEFEDGWGLIRASNTNPVLSLRFEAYHKAALQRIRDLFAKELGEIAPDLEVPAVT